VAGSADATRYRSEMPDQATAIAVLPRPEAVLFDLDGTLIDTVQIRIDSWVEVFADERIPTTREALAPLMGIDGRRLVRQVAEAAGRMVDDATAERIDRRCGEIYDRRNISPKPLPGVRELVAAIEARGLRWSIATSSRKEQVSTSVRALGLDREPTITDASHVEHAKPEPDLLLRAAEDLGVEPASCWYVGDSIWDMKAAVAARMAAVAVLAGSAVDEPALREAGASVVVATLLEIARALATA
jgi:HAD superfamily hydrolase (TIGR01509 family)